MKESVKKSLKKSLYGCLKNTLKTPDDTFGDSEENSLKISGPNSKRFPGRKVLKQLMKLFEGGIPQRMPGRITEETP